MQRKHRDIDIGKPPRALVIGYGSIGEKHAQLLQDIGAEVGVVTRRNKVFELEFPDTATALAKFDPSYVVIANETSAHMRTAGELYDAGFQGRVLIEKPMVGVNQKICFRSQQDAYVGFNFRFHPLVRALRKELRGQRIVSAEFRCGSYLPLWRKGRDHRSTASAKAMMGGGVLADLSHELDLANWLLGKWLRLTAIGGNLGVLGVETDEFYGLLVELENCAVATIVINYIDRCEERRIIINTEKTTLYADLIGATLYEGDTIIFDSAAYDFDETYRDNHRAMLSGDVGDCCTLAQAELVQSMMSAAERASRCKMWVTR